MKLSLHNRLIGYKILKVIRKFALLATKANFFIIKHPKSFLIFCSIILCSPESSSALKTVIFSL